MDYNKVLSMIGLATKAGKTKSGELAVMASIKSREAKLVFVSADASEASRKTFADKCSFYNIPVVICFSKEELGRACGKDFRTSIAINDEGFAKAINRLTITTNTEDIN